MKIKGIEFRPKSVKPVPIPREGGDIVFMMQPVYDNYEDVYPEIQAPVITRPGQDPFVDFNDETYLKKLRKRVECRVWWTLMKSLEATEGLEWETVDPKVPETFANIEKELREALLTAGEIDYLVRTALEFQKIDEAAVKEAYDRFLATQSQQAKQ